MAKPITITQIERDQLVADGKDGVTLDGYPAYVSGSRLEFARIHRKDGKGGAVEFAWPTVRHILRGSRRFQS